MHCLRESSISKIEWPKATFWALAPEVFQLRTPLRENVYRERNPLSWARMKEKARQPKAVLVPGTVKVRQPEVGRGPITTSLGSYENSKAG